MTKNLKKELMNYHDEYLSSEIELSGFIEKEMQENDLLFNDIYKLLYLGAYLKTKKKQHNP